MDHVGLVLPGDLAADRDDHPEKRDGQLTIVEIVNETAVETLRGMQAEKETEMPLGTEIETMVGIETPEETENETPAGNEMVVAIETPGGVATDTETTGGDDSL